MKNICAANGFIKALEAHATALVGDDETAHVLLCNTFLTHHQAISTGEPEALDSLLKELGKSAESASVARLDGLDKTGGHFSALPFYLKCCVSLRDNFCMPFDRIAAILEIPSSLAEEAYTAAIETLQKYSKMGSQISLYRERMTGSSYL